MTTTAGEGGCATGGGRSPPTCAPNILDGGYAPGDRLPSNADLRAQYGVSGQTVQHAMNSLRSEGSSRPVCHELPVPRRSA